jgi:hypothetical protein
MSMTSVHHVLQKSQSQGSARTLVLTVAIHANDCCGVAWPSDTTLRHEVNVSRQRIHEVKNKVEAAGELLIIERPGTTNLYFIADKGKPVGLTLEMLLDPEQKHEAYCPLRNPAEALRVARLLFETPAPQPGEPAASPPDASSISPELMQKFGIRHNTDNWPPKRQPKEAADNTPPVDNTPAETKGVSDPPDPQVSDIPDTPRQESLTQKTIENKREKKEAPTAPVSLWPEKAERASPYWCEAHGFCHGERLPDQLPGCWCETESFTAMDVV